MAEQNQNHDEKEAGLHVEAEALSVDLSGVRAVESNDSEKKKAKDGPAVHAGLEAAALAAVEEARSAIPVRMLAYRIAQAGSFPEIRRFDEHAVCMAACRLREQGRIEFVQAGRGTGAPFSRSYARAAGQPV